MEDLIYEELLILRKSLKLLILEDTNKDFEYLNKITRLGRKIDDLISMEEDETVWFYF